MLDERLGHVGDHIKLLRKLERPGSILSYSSGAVNRSSVVAPEAIKVLKATTFLLLYNVCEACTREGFDYLYQIVRKRRVSAKRLALEMQHMWIRQMFMEVDCHSASPRKYEEVCQALLSTLVDNGNFELAKSLLPVSGNIDTDVLLALCRKHGFRLKIHQAARGGRKLESIRIKRNNLAHGNVSFEELGRSTTISELEEALHEVGIVLRSLLRAIERFETAKGYRRV